MTYRPYSKMRLKRAAKSQFEQREHDLPSVDGADLVALLVADGYLDDAIEDYQDRFEFDLDGDGKTDPDGFGEYVDERIAELTRDYRLHRERCKSESPDVLDETQFEWGFDGGNREIHIEGRP